MADLRKFVWSGLHDRMKIDLYSGRQVRVIIGHGEINELKALYIRMTGTLNIPPRTGMFEIFMPDDSDTGVCTVAMNGSRQENCPYRVQGTALFIKHPSIEIKIEANDRKYTWIESTGLFGLTVGLWPQGQKMTAEDLE